MADLKPLYLVSGDDDAKIDAWRARARQRAESEGGPGALHLFDAKASRPDEVAAALAALTFDTATRYLLVDGVQAWKAAELESLQAELATIPPGTVLLLIARGKPLASLAKAVEKAGGELRECAAPKPWHMPKWAAERAREEGLRLDADAAKALVAAVGTRPQRVAREIEKLGLLAHPRTQLSAEEVERLATPEASSQAYDLADALVGGDPAAALGVAESLSRVEDRPMRLVYPIVRRLRDVHRAVELLESGVPEKGLAKAMDLSPWVAKRTVAQAKKADRDALERALCAFAELEVETRSGAEVDDDTALELTVARAAG